MAQARVWLTDSHKLGLLTLYEARIQRKIEKNLAILRQQQQDRQAALEKAVEEATLLAQLAAAKGESFDIERDYPREFLPPHAIPAPSRCFFIPRNRPSRSLQPPPRRGQKALRGPQEALPQGGLKLNFEKIRWLTKNSRAKRIQSPAPGLQPPAPLLPQPPLLKGAIMFARDANS
ncbi:hypothetical protein SBA3_540024 [Candidatus Sulfopaludibacter sp. SbA3]|nr:hypothetical protein SBA3_540024 [Candidatus Sulfopaludibacter sp. SbA3]